MAIEIAIIGAGPGGYVAAVHAAQLGARVTLIENDNVGGTCLNWGCIPSKILKSSADLFSNIGRSHEFGIQMDVSARIDIQQVMARKQKIVTAQIQGITALLKKHQVNLIHGSARITPDRRIIVKHPDLTESVVTWDRLIVATGSRPAALPMIAFDGKQIFSSNHILSLEHLPESIVIVGGGVIGCEFAFILSAFGTQVTLIEAMPRLLPLDAIDKDCSTVLTREMKKKKIALFTDKIVSNVKCRDSHVSVMVAKSTFSNDPKAVSSFEIKAEAMLVCVGRTPNTDQIGLESIDVKVDDKGWIMVDEGLNTNIENVYAIGDALGPSKIMLAHVASKEGLIAAQNAMQNDPGSRNKMDYTAVPSAVFTMPEIACVGLSEQEACKIHPQTAAETVLFRNIGKSHVIGEIAGQAKIVFDRETGQVFGVHIIGAHATDLIAEATLAISTGQTIHDIAKTIHAHPTLPEILMETSLKAIGMSIHG